MSEPSEQIENRWETIKDLWREYPFLYVIMGFFAGLMTFPLLTRVVSDLGDLLENLVPEVIGISFTVLFIDALYRRREEEQRERALKSRLRRECGSPDNATTLNAIREIRAHGWLSEKRSILVYAHLVKANLADANLYSVNLTGATLTHANLTGANLAHAVLRDVKMRQADLTRASLHETDLSAAKLVEANLTRAILYKTDLRDADARRINFTRANLNQANLQNTRLIGSNFEQAVLAGTNLTGADLREVNLNKAILEGAILKNARFDKRTRLPDGSLWEYGVDLTKFGALVNQGGSA